MKFCLILGAWLATLAPCPLAAVAACFHSLLSGIRNWGPGFLLPINLFSDLQGTGQNTGRRKLYIFFEF